MQVPSFIKNIGITGKLTSIIMVILVIVLSTSAFNTYRSFTKKLEADANTSVKRGLNALKEVLRERVLVTKEQANDQAIRPNVIAAVANHNIPQLELLGEKLIENRPGMEIVFFDLSGNTIAMVSHEKEEYTSNSDFVKDGKAGYIDSGKEILLEANAPITNNGHQIGSVTIIRRLFRDDELVDSSKRKNGPEHTIFRFDTRISTTVEKDGKRAIGTKMTDPNVLNATLNKVGTFFGEADVAGTTHTAGYESLLDPDGKPIGMFFAGISKASIQEAIKAAFIDEVTFQVPLNLLILAVTIFVLRRSIINPLMKIIHFAKEVAGGNLKAAIEIRSRYDELGTLKSSLEQMTETMVEKLDDVKSLAEAAKTETKKAELATKEAEEAKAQAVLAKSEGFKLAADRLEEVVVGIVEATGEVSEIGNDLTQNVTNMADRTTGVATAMEEMNSTVLEVARNAGSAADGSDHAKKKAHEGDESMKTLSRDLEQVREKVGSLGKMMDGLSISAKDIDQIINVINDIADQTNLLALNAAIEAARAGDAGRGFAVVADEVRKLAEKTQNATKEVSQTIHTIQERVKEGEQMVTSTDETVEIAGRSAIQTGRVLVEIVDTSDATADQVRSIATAAEEQSATSEEINRSTADIHELTNVTNIAVGKAMKKVADVIALAKTLEQIRNDLRTQ